MAELIDIRCPSDLKRLFFKLNTSGEKLSYSEENWMEIACGDCLREQRRVDMRGNGHSDALRVLHYYSFTGELMKTEVRRVGGVPLS